MYFIYKYMNDEFLRLLPDYKMRGMRLVENIKSEHFFSCSDYLFYLE